MIVCVCHRVSDRDIRRLAQDGCPDFDELQMSTGVATCCGQCEGCARDTFRQAQHLAAEAAVCFVRKADAAETGAAGLTA